MPTYEYQCTKCGHRFEEFQSMNDAPLKKCPKCKGKVERLISGGTGLIFKGSGFYINDYARSEDYKKKSKEEKSSSSPTPPPAPATDKPKEKKVTTPAKTEKSSSEKK